MILRDLIMRPATSTHQELSSSLHSQTRATTFIKHALAFKAEYLTMVNHEKKSKHESEKEYSCSDLTLNLSLDSSFVFSLDSSSDSSLDLVDVWNRFRD